MAPEQTTGAEKAGPAVDQYALGATLYEMLTGRPPFRGSSILDTLDLIRTAEPVAPSQLLPRMPRDLETICLKALQKDAARRYPDVAAMAEDLRRFRAGEPIVARPISGPERGVALVPAKPGRGIPARRGGGLAAAGHGRYVVLRDPGQRTGARRTRRRPAGAGGKARSDIRWYAAESTLAQRDWQEGQLASLERRLGVLVPHEPGAANLRGFEWYYLKRLCRLEMRTLPGHDAPVRCVAISPDGKLLASASGNYGRSGVVWVWDMATGQERYRLRGHKDLVSCVAFSPDGRRLASANGGVRTPGEIKVWNVADGGELLCMPAHAVPVRGLAFSADGRQLASAAGGVGPGGTFLPGEVKTWDAADGRQLLCIPGNEAAAWHVAFTGVAFSPAAVEPRRRLAFADGRTVRVCDPATGKELFRLGEHSSLVDSVAYSPDGRRLASASVDGTLKVWDAGTGVEMLAFHQADGLWGLAFSPDGRRIAAAAGSNIVKVWDLTTREEDLVLRGHKDSVAGVAFSPDGWQLASGSGDGAVKIWDATAPAEAVTLRGPLRERSRYGA